MNMATTRVIRGVLLAVSIAGIAGNVYAGKGRPQAHNSSGFQSGAIYGSGAAAGHANAQRNSNQNQHRYQNQHKNAHGNAWSKQAGKGSGEGLYSNDRRLSQKDFQAWLNQNQVQSKSQNQVQHRAQAVERSGL